MTDTPTVATIKFHSDRHIEVELSGIKYITPRSIVIAENLLQREFRGAKGRYNAEQHKLAREAKAKAEEDAKVDTAAFHEAEDERLAEAATSEAKALRLEQALADASASQEESENEAIEVEETPEETVEATIAPTETAANDDEDTEEEPVTG